MSRLVFVLFSLSLFLLSCKNKVKENIDIDTPEYTDTSTLISTYNSTISHNAGEDCQKCHQKGGNGKAWFQVSGTVYDSTKQNIFPHATVYLYDGLNNTAPLIASIEVDSLGNFYTTEDIPFEKGLHVEVAGFTLHAKMGSLIYKGSCNKCHGVTTNRIWTK